MLIVHGVQQVKILIKGIITLLNKRSKIMKEKMFSAQEVQKMLKEAETKAQVQKDNFVTINHSIKKAAPIKVRFFYVSRIRLGGRSARPQAKPFHLSAAWL